VSKASYDASLQDFVLAIFFRSIVEDNVVAGVRGRFHFRFLKKPKGYRHTLKRYAQRFRSSDGAGRSDKNKMARRIVASSSGLCPRHGCVPPGAWAAQWPREILMKSNKEEFSLRSKRNEIEAKIALKYGVIEASIAFGPV
jgi:hypothetical protein